MTDRIPEDLGRVISQQGEYFGPTFACTDSPIVLVPPEKVVQRFRNATIGKNERMFCSAVLAP
jgi:hypothetical protein